MKRKKRIIEVIVLRTGETKYLKDALSPVPNLTDNEYFARRFVGIGHVDKYINNYNKLYNGGYFFKAVEINEFVEEI